MTPRIKADYLIKRHLTSMTGLGVLGPGTMFDIAKANALFTVDEILLNRPCRPYPRELGLDESNIGTPSFLIYPDIYWNEVKLEIQKTAYV